MRKIFWSIGIALLAIAQIPIASLHADDVPMCSTLNDVPNQSLPTQHSILMVLNGDVGTSISQLVVEFQAEPKTIYSEPETSFDDATWSPDGRSVIFRQGGRLMMLDANSPSRPRIVLDNFLKSSSSVGIIGSLTWFPDSEHVLFWLGVPIYYQPTDVSRYQTGIYVVDVQNSDLQAVPIGNLFVSDASLSPDGKTIVFTAVDLTSDSVGSSKIYRVDINRSNPKVLIENGQSYAPQWSPDGTQIMYLTIGDDSIRTLEVSTGKIQTIAHGVSPVFSPDGRHVAYVYQDELYRADVDGSNACQLTDHQKEIDDTKNIYEDENSYVFTKIENLKWSPDSMYLAFTYDIDVAMTVPPDENGEGADGGVFTILSYLNIIQPEGAEKRLLNFVNDYFLILDWQPIYYEWPAE